MVVVLIPLVPWRSHLFTCFLVSHLSFSTFFQLHKCTDVFDNVGRCADFLNLVVGDSHVKNLAKREMRNKEAGEKMGPPRRQGDANDHHQRWRILKRKSTSLRA